MLWGRLAPLISAFPGWRRWREGSKPLALQSFPLEAPSLPELEEQLRERLDFLTCITVSCTDMN